MAITYIGATALASADLSSNVSPDFSGLSPATNDVIIAHLELERLSGIPSASAPTGQGWIGVYDTVLPGAVTRSQVFYKIWGAGATDNSSPTFTNNGVNFGEWGAVISVWRGCSTTTPIEAKAFVSGSTTTNPVTVPSATSLGSGRTALRLVNTDVAPSTLSTPSEGTTIYSGSAYAANDSAANGLNVAFFGSYTSGLGTGAVGTMTVQMSDPGFSPDYWAATLILAPANNQNDILFLGIAI